VIGRNQTNPLAVAPVCVGGTLGVEGEPSDQHFCPHLAALRHQPTWKPELHSSHLLSAITEECDNQPPTERGYTVVTLSLRLPGRDILIVEHRKQGPQDPKNSALGFLNLSDVTYGVVDRRIPVPLCQLPQLVQRIDF
jgi:hypothetical protein